MLFNCESCGRVGFDEVCPKCGVDKRDDNVPLDPRYYPEFQYRSQGMVKDLLVKKKTEKALDARLEAVLAKHEQFKAPYFVNFMHLAGQGPPDPEQLQLFHLVLVRLGFDELDDPVLTAKLVGSTAFRFQYDSFVARTAGHLRPELPATLRSWIDERGPAFRQDLPMLLYWLWDSDNAAGAVAYTDGVPLIAPAEYVRIRKLCESIYLDLLVTRLKTALEQFNPDRFVTIYRVDAMDGFEFEDFLGLLFTTLGYDIETTKRTGDQGADLFAQRFGRRIVIQAKRYIDRVGNFAVQQVLAAKTFFNCDDAMVVSNSYFTRSAEELAEAAGVKLVDRRALQSYLDEYNQAIMDQAARESSEGEAMPAG